MYATAFLHHHGRIHVCYFNWAPFPGDYTNQPILRWRHHTVGAASQTGLTIMQPASRLVESSATTEVR